MDIDILRNEIDIIDKQILKLFIKRMECCKKISKIKKENNLPIFNKEREDEILKSISNLSGEYNKECCKLFKNIMDISKEMQMSNT